MSEPTNNNPPLTNDASLTIDLTVLDHSEFRKGFASGLEAYLSEVEERGCPISIHEMYHTIRHELDPNIRQRDLRYCAHMKWPAPSQMYSIGFLAGWTAAHTSTSLAITPATT